MRKILLISILIVVTAFGGYQFFKTPKIEAVNPQFRRAVQAVYASGSVKPRLEVSLASSFTVRIMKLFFDEGDTLTKGDVLAEFEFPEYEAQLKELVLQENLARVEFKRNRSLFDGKAISKDVLDRSETSFKVFSASRQRIESIAKNYSLRAPFDGMVIRRDAEVGEIKSPADTLFWVSSMDGLRVTAEVDEEDMYLVEVSQKALLRSDASPDAVFEGLVEQITERGNFISRTFRVRIGLNEKTGLKPGMSVEANIITRESDSTLMVPHSSIRDGKVLLFNGGALIPTIVKTGIVGKSGTEIISGLSEHSKIARNWNDVDDSEKRYMPISVNW
jgi:RND family efflux transporter MFP subunit